MYIAGIDGGGTHTRIEIRDADNNFVRRGEFGPCNLNAIGEDAFRSLLVEIFRFCGDMTQVSGLCFGTAGVSNPEVSRILEEELKNTGFEGALYLCGDQEIALRGAMDSPGIVVIAGTGSICFGKNAEGKTARSGGYGHLIDDGGSGYALGRDVLSTAVRAVDGRGNSWGILNEVYAKINGCLPSDIVSFVYDKKTEKADIARFAPIALRQAELGDWEAWRILARGADDLYEMVKAVQQRLDLRGCRIALLGGLLGEENPYRNAVAEKLTYLGTVVPANHDALWGAAQIAFEQQKQ